MRGLLADANVEGHQELIERLLDRMGLLRILAVLGLEFSVLSDIGLPNNIDDRTLWQRCQDEGWVLFTDNRNAVGESSLQATLEDSWALGKFPVVTLADKRRFEHSPEYRERVAADIADVLFGVAHGEYLDCDRIFVPR